MVASMAGLPSDGLEVVTDFGRLLDDLLEKASSVKRTATVEPPLNRSDLSEIFERVDSVFSPLVSNDTKKHAIDIAARNTFNELLVSRIFLRASELFI